MDDNLPAFVATTLLMLIVPGPDFVLVTRNAVTGDRRTAYRTVAGVCAGLGFLTLLAAAGLAALLAASPAMMTVLRFVGGGYLAVLGTVLVISVWRRWRNPRPESPVPHSTRSPVVQGFLNNVLNPKALIFYLAFMPQFMVQGPPVFAQTLLLGALVVLCAAAWWSVYVAVIAYVRPLLQRGGVRSAIDLGAGSALGAFGLVAVLGAV
ncbi:LysE family translocator [Parasphingorhabdus pacifica]